MADTTVTTRMFVDRQRVTRTVDRNRLRILATIGAHGRSTMKGMQRSVGRNGPPSQPGEAPHARYGLMKRLTLFGLDDNARTAVVGVMPVPGMPKDSYLHDGQVGVPQMLNEGGRETFSRIALNSGRPYTQTVRYQARPFTLLTAKQTMPFARQTIRRQTLTR